MISQRTHGLLRTLLVCQSVLAGCTFWVAMEAAIALFSGVGTLHLVRYPLYAGIVVLGLAIELMNRNLQKLPPSLFQWSFFDQHAISIRQTIFAIGTLLAYLALARDSFISRTVLAIYAPILYLVLLWSNRALPRLLSRQIFHAVREDRALLIGSLANANRLRAWIRDKESVGFQTLGILTDAPVVSGSWLPCLGKRSDLERTIVERRITVAVLLELPASSEAHRPVVETLENHGVRILILSNLEKSLGHPAVHVQDGGLSFITTREEPLENPINRIAKRALDLAVSLPVVLFILPPAMLIVWLLQRWHAPGPVFFRQRRAGIQNRPFEILKFRSMRADHTDFSRQATHDDDRIYPVGRWLRRLSIDELPQFWNVLFGDMSVVGPRPHLVEHNTAFARQLAGYHIRAFVKPGITGLAQVRGFRGEVQSANDIRQRLDSDIYYLENWRFTFDVAIIFRTAIQTVIFSGNCLLRARRRLFRAQARASDLPAVPATGIASEDDEGLYPNCRQILGLPFFLGSAAEAVQFGMRGGVVVAPSAPALLEMEEDPAYRSAVRESSLILADSGLMVSLWKLLTGEAARRISRLEYLRLLLEQPELRRPGAAFWIMPNAASMQRHLDWLQRHDCPVSADDCYLAPQFNKRGAVVCDAALVETIQRRRPPHIIVALAGGVQEKLATDLFARLDYRPAIHCTGAAIGFLSGDQVCIPMWANEMRLGWLFRCVSDPRKSVPRYWAARQLLSLMIEYHAGVPTPAKAPDLRKPLENP